MANDLLDLLFYFLFFCDLPWSSYPPSPLFRPGTRSNIANTYHSDDEM